MRFPSLSQIAADAGATLKRFPFVIAIAAIGAVVVIWLIGLPWQEREHYQWLTKLGMVCMLGIPVFIAVTTFSEGRGIPSTQKNLLNAAALLLLALYYFLLDDRFPREDSEPLLRYLLFVLAAHLLVSFAPFIQKGSLSDFWEYNKNLFLRFLLAALFSAALFAGLSIALLSLDNLLGIEIDDDCYAQLWFFIAGVFNTWFFVAGIPKRDEMYGAEKEFPRGLKIFAQYILIPLVSIYIIILYLYTGKIILEWQLPNGWVSNLVLGYSIAGIFSLLLLYPIRNDANHRWIQLFSRSYYIALMPLIILLGLSIWVRISAYGITVNRYFVVVLALWLTGMVAYYLISDTKSIKVIPVSLCIIVIFASFGPQGAFSVSVQSQKNQIYSILKQHEMLNAENQVGIQAAGASPSYDEQRQLSSAFRYIISLRGLHAVQPFFEQDLMAAIGDSALHKKSAVQTATKVMELIRLEYVPEYQMAGLNDETGFNFFSNSDAVQLGDYDYFIASFSVAGNGSATEIKGWKWQFNPKSYSVTLTELKTEASIEVPLYSFLKELVNESAAGKAYGEIPAQLATLTVENNHYRVLLHIQNAGGSLADSTLNYLNGNLFISRK